MYTIFPMNDEAHMIHVVNSLQSNIQSKKANPTSEKRNT
jgi:hypothetical protein